MDTHEAWMMLLVKIFLFCFFGVGAFLCALNFYLSFLRYPLYCLRGRKAEYRYVSGAPLFGSLLVAALVFPLELPNWARVASFALVALDTGGLHWIIGIVAWQAIKKARTSRHQG